MFNERGALHNFWKLKVNEGLVGKAAGGKGIWGLVFGNFFLILLKKQYILRYISAKIQPKSIRNLFIINK